MRLYLTSYPKVEVLDIESDGEDIQPQLKCPEKQADTSVVEEGPTIDLFASQLGREVHVSSVPQSNHQATRQQI